MATRYYLPIAGFVKLGVNDVRSADPAVTHAVTCARDGKDSGLSLQDLEPKAVKIRNGMELNYVRSGRGPQLIFIHGAMGDWRAWAPQWEAFTEHFDCVSYSRRYSHPNPNPMNTRSHNALVDAEDLEGLMDALGIDEAVLVGSSYGAFTALAMAVRAPDRVRAVAGVEAPMMRYAKQTEAGAKIVRAFLETSADPARAAFERGDDEEGVRILTGGIIGRRPADVPAHVMERRMQNMQAARSLALSDDEFPLIPSEALAGLQMPVLLMSGAETAPVHAAIFAAVTEAMPHARTRIIDGSGHGVSQQQPAKFNAEVLDFLADNGLLQDRLSA